MTPTGGGGGEALEKASLRRLPFLPQMFRRFTMCQTLHWALGTTKDTDGAFDTDGLLSLQHPRKERKRHKNEGDKGLRCPREEGGNPTWAVRASVTGEQREVIRCPR